MVQKSPKIYLQELLNQGLQAVRFKLAPDAFSISVPNEKFGDYATNVALVLAKKNRQAPSKLAETLAIRLRELDGAGVFSDISPADGFINFRLSNDILSGNLSQVLKAGEAYGRLEFLQGKKIMIEYTDPNPFKEFHIGHLMSNAIGESIARIFEANGAKVLRVNWQGDVGIHVAKAVWGMIDLKLNIQELNPSQLGKAYAHGAQRFEADQSVKKAITQINKRIFFRDDQQINRVYDAGREVSLRNFETLYRRLGTKFDYYFFESKEGVEGKAIVESGLQTGIFEKSGGAVIFRGEKFGLHTRVFINSEGLPTYEAKELGLNKKKFELEPNLSRSIIVTGSEIKEYFRVMLKVMAFVFPDIASKTVHLPHGMMRLPAGKMSSRTGDVITAEWLIAEVRKRVLDKVAQREIVEEQKRKIAELVAIGAIKYSILRQDSASDIIFDFEKSLSFEGDSGPYLQYTHARACSVLKKAAEDKLKSKVSSELESTSLERMLVHFPEVVGRTGSEYSPHLIAKYLLDLAAAFNRYYADEKIVDPQDPRSPHKLAITGAVAQVLKNGLNLLGIEAPEEM